ncbi:MAG: NUDIX hydrolase [Candidatus Saccharibacteria bacterium]
MENLAWERQAPTDVTKVGYRTIVNKTFTLPDGLTKTFATSGAEESAAVATIAITKDNKVLVVNLFRPGPEKVMQEIPGGGVEPGEDDLALAAARELAEETGHKVGSIAYLGYCHYDAYTNGKRHYFLARDCEPTGEGQKLDAEEQLTVSEISIEQLIQNALQGNMTDPGAVMLAYDQLHELA